MWEKVIELSLGFLLDLVTLKYPIEVIALLLGLAIVYGTVHYITLRCFGTKDSMSHLMSAILSAFMSIPIVGMCRFIMTIVQNAWPVLGIPTSSLELIPLIILCMLIGLSACFHLFILAVIFREGAMRWNRVVFIPLLIAAVFTSSIFLKAVYSVPGMIWAGYFIAGGIAVLISAAWYSLHFLAAKESKESNSEEESQAGIVNAESSTI